MDKTEISYTLKLVIKELRDIENATNRAITQLSDSSAEINTTWRWLADLVEELEKSK